MPDYKETQVIGTSWWRCPRVEIYNPLGGPRLIRFAQESVLQLPDGPPYHKDRPMIEFALQPGTESTAFPILNPNTGEAVGSATYGEVYALLHSLYLHFAQAPAAAPVSETGGA